MHGAGTVSGSQVVPAIASKICCARVLEIQLNHHQKGQQMNHQMRQRSHQIQFKGHGIAGGGLGGIGGKGGMGPSGVGAKARTSIIL